MMREGKEMPRVSGPLRIAALSALISACAHQMPYDTIPTRREAPSALSSHWARGTCEFSSGSLGYADLPDGSSAKIVLDVPVHRPEALLCSEGFTVILTSGSAVVSLGGDGIISGREMLGIIGGRMVMANSYEISTLPLASEGGGRRGGRLDGDILALSSADGREWTISLSSPFQGWNIY